MAAYEGLFDQYLDDYEEFTDEMLETFEEVSEMFDTAL